jgi:hypothetical protein
MDRINKGVKCEIEGSPHKGEPIIEMKQLIDDYGIKEMISGGPCQYYLECAAVNVRCKYTKMIGRG